MLCCNALIILCIMLNIVLMRKPVSHFVPNWLDYCITSKDCYIIFIYIDYTDYFVATFIHELNPSYYAGIMLDAFKDLLCSKLCWHNRPGPISKASDSQNFNLLVVFHIFHEMNITMHLYFYGNFIHG